MAEAVVDIAGYGPIRVDTGDYAPTPQALKQMLDEKFSELRNFVDTVYKGMRPEDKAALWTMPIPIVGDVAGLYADATMYIQDPESRNIANYLLSAAGAVPFIPGASTARTVAGESIDKAVETVKKNLNAWHGSPHRFDKFSMSQIGTGEGAQTFSHGLYFAEQKEVAQEYRRGISPDSAGSLYNVNLNVDQDDLLDWDAPLSEQPRIAEAMQRFVDEKLEAANGNILLTDGATQQIAEALKYPSEVKGWDLYSSIENEFRYGQKSNELDSAYIAAAKDAIANQVDPVEVVTSSYGVDQNVARRAAIEAIGGPGAAASELFKKAGVPGTRYFDGYSRAAGEGTRNFVIFDDSLVDIKSVE